MPVFQAGPNQAPEWCELEQFDIVRLTPGQTHVFPRLGHREKLVVGKGRCRASIGPEEVNAAEGAILEVGPDVPYAQLKVVLCLDEVTVVRMAGHWGEETGGCGLFGGAEVEEPSDPGDPADYEKRTAFDSHWHDCDEYWIILEGRGVAVSEGKRYQVGPGDCVATGMGHHHDMPLISEPIKAVYFETTLEGQKRLGHLWSHTHGEAQPKADRV